jgi:hypothetical protein
MKTKPVVTLVAAAGLLCTASILAGLRHRLTRHDNPAPEPEQDPREGERLRIEKALGHMIVKFDPALYASNLERASRLPDRDTLRRSMPRSNRPAWWDLRDDRDGR